MRLGSTGRYERQGLRPRDGAVGSQGEGGGSFVEAYGKAKVCAFLLRPGFRAEPNRVWCITARRCDVRPSVTVQVSNRETVDCPFVIWCALISHHDIRLAVAIQIRDGDRVRHPRPANQHNRVAEVSLSTIEINEEPLPFVAHHEIGTPVDV